MKLIMVLTPGSSPRVRSRLCKHVGDMQRFGIISACAEQTPARRLQRRVPGDHLRVCGADWTSFIALRDVLGSSPRVRSRLLQPIDSGAQIGIISACAEQTRFPSVVLFFTTDHLRVCGADWLLFLPTS